MTAYTLYTYKHKIAVITDSFHSPASAFISEFSTKRLSPPVGLVRTPVWVLPWEAHLPGRPADTYPLPATSSIEKLEDTWCVGGGAGDGPCWAQLVSPVVPDDVIISSGAHLVHWDDRCQLFLALFLGRIVFGFPRYMKNSCTEQLIFNNLRQ